MFGRQLDRFAVRSTNVVSVFSQLSAFMGLETNYDATEAQLLEIHADVEEELTTFKKHIRLRLRTIILCMAILFLLFLYVTFRLED